jgi:glycogen phosphorylase
VILPKYYAHPDAYAEVMRSTIALNGSFFNTQRMLAQYMSNAHYPRTNVSSESTVHNDVKLETGVASKVL